MFPVSLVAAGLLAAAQIPPGAAAAPAAPVGIFNIDHIVIIMQENRSFDHYFGTYPGAAGIPTKPNGDFSVCAPHPVLGKCLPPFHTSVLTGPGGPHTAWASNVDVNHGRMNGYIRAVVMSGSPCAVHPNSGGCAKQNGPRGQPSAMSYMDDREIPNYWAYADEFVLQDHMFASVDSWSLPAHHFLVSGWSAVCKTRKPGSCHGAKSSNSYGPYSWTDITYLLRKGGVSWAYYVGNGTNLNCGEHPCPPNNPKTASPPWWNPLPGYVTVQSGHQLGRIQHTSDFFKAAGNGTLPSVSWVIPPGDASEHPEHGSMRPGQEYVTRVINALGSGPDWGTTAIFLTWDDWGGFYDHMDPPNADRLGYGIRVPGLVISPYAKQGYIDSQVLTWDAYLKLIEDRFLGGQRLDPKTDGRPDPRPGVREENPKLGDITAAFDFTQPARPPLILDPTP